MIRWISAVLIGAMAISGLFVTMAQTAQAGHGNRGYNAHGSAYYSGGRHYRGPRHYRAPRHYRGNRYYHRRNRISGGDVLLGVGAGVLLYSIIDSANNRRAPVYNNVQPYNNYPQQSTYAIAEPPRYAPRPGPVPTRSSYESDVAPNCLQTREYQTTITIGGEAKDAYGTACLQPDGSWMMGEAQLVPEFN